jgi:hypothetical protein
MILFFLLLFFLLPSRLANAARTLAGTQAGIADGAAGQSLNDRERASASGVSDG